MLISSLRVKIHSNCDFLLIFGLQLPSHLPVYDSFLAFQAVYRSSSFI